MRGWVKFHRAMLDHAVWGLPPGQFKVWDTILMTANIKPAEWYDGLERVQIAAGAQITSQDDLAKQAKVGRQVVRDALKNLERIGSIRTKTRTKRWTFIEVVNWHLYQGADTDENLEANQPGTYGEPTANHNLRRKEGEKERKNHPSPSLEEYLARMTPGDQEVIRQVVAALATTRKTGRISPAIIGAEVQWWSQHPVERVLAGMRTYLAKGYAGQGKKEAYLRGIVRNLNGQGPGQDDGRPRLTPGEEAIRRAALAMTEEDVQP